MSINGGVIPIPTQPVFKALKLIRVCIEIEYLTPSWEFDTIYCCKDIFHCPVNYIGLTIELGLTIVPPNPSVEHINNNNIIRR